MTRLKGVVIGAGYFSHFHLNAWGRIEQVEILAICDQDESKANLLAQEYNIPKTYRLLGEMLDKERPDFIDIVTPPPSRLNIIESAISHNINIICQKPLADTFEEVLHFKKIIDKSQIRFMAHENWRFQPWYRTIKHLIDNGAVGDQIFQINFKMRMGDGWGHDAYLDRQPYFRTMPRMLVHETGVHFVDTFRYLGGEIASVYAQLKTLNANITGEDAGMILFDFQSGATGLLDANRYNEPDYENARYTFGRMSIEGNKGSIWLHPDGQISAKKLGEQLLAFDFNPPKTGFCGDSVFTCQQHFIDACIHNTPFETNIDEYIKTLSVVEGIYRSNTEGQKIPLLHK